MNAVLNILISCSIFLISCNEIKSGKEVKKETVDLIKSLDLLDKDETIIKYYSNHTEELAGNFFTNKRIAHYWLVENSRSGIDIDFAYYNDIISIDTTFEVAEFSVPYMKITKSDSSSFRVFVGGQRSEVEAFFEEAKKEWKNKRSPK